MSDQFRARIEAIFPESEVSNDYLELPDGNHYAAHEQRPCPWVEFGLQSERDGQCHAEVTFDQLKRLAVLLGTEWIEVSGQNRGSFRDGYLWLTAYDVQFDADRAKTQRQQHALQDLLPKAKSSSEVRRIAVQAGLDPAQMVAQFGPGSKK